MGSRRARRVLIAAITAALALLSTVPVGATGLQAGLAGSPPVYEGTRAVFASPDVPKAIPDGSPTGVASTLEIESRGEITDLDVQIEISHTYVSDLVVALTHVDTGTSVVLIDRILEPNQTCRGEDIAATLDDEAATAIEDECGEPAVPAIAGTFSPNEALEAFDAEDIGGTWELTVADEAADDTGTVTAWSLSVERTAGAQVALYGDDSNGWLGEASATVFGVGDFEQLDAFDAATITPSAADLARYDSVMVWSDLPFADATGFGNALADYVDDGGGVVVAGFSWVDTTNLAGRIASAGYLPLTTSGDLLSDDGPFTLLPTRVDHPLLGGVASVDGGTGSFRSVVSPTPGALLVASWSSPGSEPFVAVKTQPTAHVVGLNLFPPSSDSRTDFWDAASDGAQLMANALTYAATPPLLCNGHLATISGTPGDDVLNGTAGDDVIAGGLGDDTIRGSGGDDIICGGNGADDLFGGPGDDQFFGGGGTDFVGYGNAPAAVTVDLSAGTAAGEGSDRLFSIEDVAGSSLADTLRGSDVANVLKGNGGNDVIDGGAGPDVLAGGDGDDQITGGGGNDVVDGYAGDDVLDGGYGADLVRGWADDDLIVPGGGDDTVLGGNGVDSLSYAAATAAVVVDLIAGTATGSGNDSVAGIRDVIGTAYADAIGGDYQANVIDAGDGDDAVRGQGGADSLFGGPGADEIWGDGGDDALDGGEGSDTLRGGTGADTIAGLDGDDVLFGGDGPDLLDGGVGSNSLYGGPGSDECTNGPVFSACEIIT